MPARKPLNNGGNHKANNSFNRRKMKREPKKAHEQKRISLFKPPFTKNLKAGKVILRPGKAVGEHIKSNREEAIVVLKGTATISLEGKKIRLSKGQVCYIGPEKKHNVKNTSSQKLEYIYIVSLLNNPSQTTRVPPNKKSPR